MIRTGNAGVETAANIERQHGQRGSGSPNSVCLTIQYRNTPVLLRTCEGVEQTAFEVQPWARSKLERH